jgi:riboflavin kinase/FMN adenylyltransferase
MPTANLAVSAIRLVPLDGVYGGIATLNGVEYPAATSVGTNPQFTADQANPPRTVEVHLIGYDGPDFYGAHLDVTFEQRIRGQRTFESIDALVARMREDVCEVEKGVQIRHSSR